jgi:hypothetical protein
MPTPSTVARDLVMALGLTVIIVGIVVLVVFVGERVVEWLR